jgi:hypothetical protein
VSPVPRAKTATVCGRISSVSSSHVNRIASLLCIFSGLEDHMISADVTLSFIHRSIINQQVILEVLLNADRRYRIAAPNESVPAHSSVRSCLNRDGLDCKFFNLSLKSFHQQDKISGATIGCPSNTAAKVTMCNPPPRSSLETTHEVRLLPEG